MTVGFIVQAISMFQVVFWKNPVLVTDQSGESGDYSRLRVQRGGKCDWQKLCNIWNSCKVCIVSCDICTVTRCARMQDMVSCEVCKVTRYAPCKVMHSGKVHKDARCK